MARTYLIGCLLEVKGTQDFISLPCKQSFAFKITVASPIIITFYLFYCDFFFLLLICHVNNLDVLI